MRSNPWGLTDLQVEAIEAYIDEGNEKAAAASIGRSTQTFSYRIGTARKRMNARTRLHVAITYDRWKRGEAETPAQPALSIAQWVPV